MLVTAVRLVVIILRVLQLSLDVEGGDFSTISPNVSGLVMPYETRKCQRINYKLLNEFGHRSVDLDEHMNNEVSSETGVISLVKNSPIFTAVYLHTEDAMDDIKTEEKKYVGSVLNFEDKSDEEDLEATLAELREEKEMIMKRNRRKQLLEQIKKEKSELEKLKQTDGASSSGKKKKKMVDEKEEKTKSGSSGSGKQTSHKTEINMNDLRCNKKLLKSVNKQLKSLHLMSDSSSNSDNSSDDSENYSTTSGAMIKKKKKILKKCS